MLKVIYFLFFTSLVLASCSVNNTDLPPVEERVKEAVDGLRFELLAPSNGWRLEYQPTEEAGTFLMLLNFDADGNVRIQSDVADNAGEFYDQTITYRIDNAQGLELILETFAVFHHLFELESATFGGEFEFLYKRKDGVNLIFESISDGANPTQLVFIPAGANDANEFSRELAANLEQFRISNPQILISSATKILPTQQLILNDRNISIFWNIDFSKRNLTVEFAGVGTTRDQVIAGNKVTLNQFSKYTFSNGKIVLDNPLSFGLNGQQQNISEITLTDFDFTGPDYCASGSNNTTPRYTGQDPSLGAVTLINTYLSNRGSEFTPTVYTVNALFIFDDQGNSLLEEGSISQKFPNASGFVLFYGVPLNDPLIPIYSVGLIMDDGEIYVRAYQPTTTKVNLVQISLLDQYYYSATPPTGTEQDLKDITDEIFAGGEFYAFDEPIEGLKLFRLFNPCNKYEFFLVQ